MENLLDQPVDYPLSLWVSGGLEAEREVSLDAGGRVEVDLTVRRSEEGSYGGSSIIGGTIRRL